MMIEYDIFYDDGSHIRCDHHGVESLSPYGVVAIVQLVQDKVNPDRKHVAHHKDFYLYNGESFIPVDYIGLVDHVVNKLSTIKKVLVGRTVDNGKYDEILTHAKTYL